jgi:hypothetical protein
MKTNMKSQNAAALAMSALLFGACIPSVNPFYTAKDVIFDAALTGEWRTKDSTKKQEQWQFEPGEGKSYNLTITDADLKTGAFEARLFTLKTDRFLDIVPSDPQFATNQVDLVGCAVFPGHLLVRVSQTESELKLRFCNFDWLEKFLQEHPNALAHRTEGKRILLTAATADLQKFVLEHLGDGELFDEAGELVRPSGKTPPAK